MARTLSVELTPRQCGSGRGSKVGMTKRIEQSRRHGYFDPRWMDRLHVVAESNASVVNAREVVTGLPAPLLGSVIEEDATFTSPTS